jgi:hypothetical protein
MIINRSAQTGARMYGHSQYVADVFAFFVPDFFHLLGGSGLIAAINASYRCNAWEAAVYLGIVNLIIIGVALRKGVGIPRRYFAGLLSFLVLSMGTNITVLGKQLPVPLPYIILQHIRFITNARVPSRWIVFVYLFLAIIVGYALREMLPRNGDRTAASVRYVFISLLIVADFYSICTVTTTVDLPRAYLAIERDDEEFGILDLPGGVYNSERYMMYQTLHGLPIVQGVLSRKISESLIDRLNVNDPLLIKPQLEQSRVKYIVLHKDLFSTPDVPETINLDDYREAYQSIYEDQRALVLQVY